MRGEITGVRHGVLLPKLGQDVLRAWKGCIIQGVESFEEEMDWAACSFVRCMRDYGIERLEGKIETYIVRTRGVLRVHRC